jgi:7-cyano-7-deazaguanine synthase
MRTNIMNQNIFSEPGGKAVVILSGGMDSTTLLYDVIAHGYEVYTLSFNYGQRHAKELEYAIRTCKKLKIPHKVVGLGCLNELLQGSSQTDINVPVPHGRYDEESMKLTVVPNRNMIMLSIAAGYAISIKAKALFYGAHAGDHSIYPDCRPGFVSKLAEAIRIADWHKLELYAPYSDMDKGDIAILGLDIGVDFKNTWSCYEGKETPCLKCLDGDTTILLSDFSCKKIKEVKIGEEIISVDEFPIDVKKYRNVTIATITNKWKTFKEIRYEIELVNGNKIIVGEEHQFLISKYKGNNNFWVTTKQLIKSKYKNIYYIPYQEKTKEWYKGYLLGYTEGDGCITNQYNDKHYTCLYVAKSSNELREGIGQVCDILNINYKMKIHNGGSVYGKYPCLAIYDVAWIENIKAMKLKNIVDFSDEFLYGYLSGLIDSDGNRYKSSSYIYQSKLKIVDKIEKVLNNLNLEYTKYKGKIPPGKTIIVNGKSKQMFKGSLIPYTFTIYGNKIKMISHSLIKRKNTFVKCSYKSISNKIAVKNITRLNSGVMYDIQTSSGTFIANGIIVHNCGACQERIEAFKKAGVKDPALE